MYCKSVPLTFEKKKDTVRVVPWGVLIESHTLNWYTCCVSIPVDGSRMLLLGKFDMRLSLESFTWDLKTAWRNILHLYILVSKKMYIIYIHMFCLVHILYIQPLYIDIYIYRYTMLHCVLYMYIYIYRGLIVWYNIDISTGFARRLEAVPSFTMLCSFRRGANECCIHGLGHRPGRKKTTWQSMWESTSFFILMSFFFNWWLTIWQFGRGLGKQKLAGNSAGLKTEPYDYFYYNHHITG